MPTEVLQEFNLAQGALGENLFAKDIRHLFNGDPCVCLVVKGGTRREKRGAGKLLQSVMLGRGAIDAPRVKSLPDDAIGTLAEFLGHGVSLIDDKVLVKRLEDLASL